MQEITLELTNKCANQCWHCSSEAHSKGSISLDKEKAIRLLREANTKFGVTQVNLSGGEPFEYSYLFDIIEEAAMRDMSVRIYTSGSLLPLNSSPFDKATPIPDSVAVDLRHFKNARICVNVLGAKDVTHNRLANFNQEHYRSPSYHNLLISLATFLRAGHDVEAAFVPCRENQEELPALATMLGNMGVYKLKILRLVEQGRAIESLDRYPFLRLTAEEENALVDQALNLSRSCGVQIWIGAPFNHCMFSKKPCALRSWSSDRDKEVYSPQKIVVTPGGTILPCEAMKGNRAHYSGPKTLQGAVESPSFLTLRGEATEEDLYTVCPVHHAPKETD